MTENTKMISDGMRTDEELAVLAKTDERARGELIERYKKAVVSTARKYYISGGDTEDLIQEGMIGLFKAIFGFKEGGVFGRYAFTCIRSSVITALKRSLSDKNRALNSYIPLFDGEDDDKTEYIIDSNGDPEQAFIDKESVRELRAKIENALSDMENSVLRWYLNGDSYETIAEKLKKDVKAADNAVQRIRKKIRRIIADQGA